MSWTDIVKEAKNIIRDTFGNKIIYEPISGPPVHIQGIFKTVPTQINDGEGLSVISNQHVLYIILSDLFNRPIQGDVVTIKGNTYQVTHMEEDMDGGANLYLHKL